MSLWGVSLCEKFLPGLLQLCPQSLLCLVIDMFPGSHRPGPSSSGWRIDGAKVQTATKTSLNDAES